MKLASIGPCRRLLVSSFPQEPPPPPPINSALDQICLPIKASRPRPRSSAALPIGGRNGNGLHKEKKVLPPPVAQTPGRGI
jgi:hypothetical protein